MAVKDFKASKHDKKSLGIKICVALAGVFACLTAICCGFIFENNAVIKQNEAEVSSYYDKTARVVAENEYYSEIMKNEYDKEYFEQFAREVYDYCRPGEEVYHFPAY